MKARIRVVLGAVAVAVSIGSIAAAPPAPQIVETPTESWIGHTCGKTCPHPDFQVCCDPSEVQ